jgi:hypothetical protein
LSSQQVTDTLGAQLPAQRKSEAAGQAAFAQATIDALLAPCVAQ